MSAVNFPKGYRCDPVVREMYPELDRQMLPIIKAKARRLNRFAHVDIDDAIQEGRLALLNALIRYDYNRGNGNLERFVSVVLNNAYKAMLYEALTQSRMPRVAVRSDGGEWLKVPRAPLSLDSILEDVLPGADGDPERVLRHSELEAEARVFRLRMINKLQGRDLDVFMLKVNPPAEFLKMVQNMSGDVDEPTNLHVAKYLGIDKNAVDWSLYKIRMLFTKLSKQREFIELFGDALSVRGSWPMIHVSEEPRHDIEFVRGVIRDRRLDPKPLANYHMEADHCQSAGDHARLIERYSWGVVLVLKRGAEYRTLVCEGKFNPLTGVLTGSNGTREPIPVPWYKQLVKSLQQEKRDGQGQER